LRKHLIAAMLSLAATAVAWSFDYGRYPAVDLDDLLAQRRPSTGADIPHIPPLRLTVELISYAEPCEAAFLKQAMLTSGVPKDRVDAMPVITCIKIRSAKGNVLTAFIQDPVAASLPKEVPLGSKVMLFAIHVYTMRDGPGLLVNEFFAGDSTVAGRNGGCGCGSPQVHTGTDFKAAAGAPVPLAYDGVVVKIETDERAMVDTRDAGWCGRYVVVKHALPNGRAVFTRYAQLGRLAGADGKPLRVGMRLKQKDKIGEVGSRGEFHFELRPADSEKMDASALWQRRYAADPAMEWSKYAPVDPGKFDIDAFAGQAKTPGEAKPNDTATTASPAGESGPLFKDGEWRRTGPSFVCTAAPAREIPRDKFDPEELGRACLHIGPFRVGMPAQTLKSVLGEPHKTLPQPGGVTAWLYFLDQREQFPYFIGFVRQDRIVALQTSGVVPAPSKEYSFNHIDLGTDTDALLKVFGPVTKTQPAGVKNTDLWTYGPWPFSFEVSAGHVTSIRITDPTFH
jgi:Peptidase family M23